MRRERWRNFDFWLFGVVIILCFFGIVMIQSALAGNLEVSINSQILYVSIGLVFILACAFFDYHYLDSLANILYVGIILLLLGLRLFGTAAFGSARWFRLGPISLQPSEFAKTILIIRLAKYFSDHENDKHDMAWIIKSFALTFGIVVFILLQPNMSTSIVMMVLWFSMIWASGIPIKKLAILGMVGFFAAIGLLVWIFVSPETVPFVQEYQLNRVRTFLAPDPDARYGDSYNIDQAVISLGSGRLFGQGYGNGTQVQLRFLKVRHTDFIFSALGQEFGFIGAMLVIIVLSFMVLRIIHVARNAPDFFGALICYGIATLFFFQMVVNMGVNLQVLPVTGLTLPFISYGGSSTMALAMAIGLVECVAVSSEKKKEIA
jgi:rod shape determining protein RodA